MLHIGRRIQEVVKEQGMTVVAFAQALPCSRETAYRIFQKDSIDTRQLKRICTILEHDFFKEISECN